MEATETSPSGSVTVKIQRTIFDSQIDRAELVTPSGKVFTIEGYKSDAQRAINLAEKALDKVVIP